MRQVPLSTINQFSKRSLSLASHPLDAPPSLEVKRWRVQEPLGGDVYSTRLIHPANVHDRFIQEYVHDRFIQQPEPQPRVAPP